MEIGMVGLGKMGGNMTKKLLKKNHRVVVYDVNEEIVNKYNKKGAIPSNSLKKLVENIESKKKIVWVMVPAGDCFDLVFVFGLFRIVTQNENFQPIRPKSI